MKIEICFLDAHHRHDWQIQVSQEERCKKTSVEVVEGGSDLSVLEVSTIIIIIVVIISVVVVMSIIYLRDYLYHICHKAV